MEAVERYGLPILRASEELCAPYDYNLCIQGIISSLKAIARGNHELYVKGCQNLSLAGSAVCLQSK